mmetsp:Transcript_13063/g.14156  ORF Transcript_13063/g.14156 Transcript_13063/m.14156 type:complete len:113 (+) Transcript_13063:2-340(+)
MSPVGLRSPSARHLSSYVNTVVVQAVLEKDVAIIGEAIPLKIVLKLEAGVKRPVMVQLTITPPVDWGVFLSGWSGSKIVTLTPGEELELRGLTLVGVKTGPVHMQHLVRWSW